MGGSNVNATGSRQLLLILPPLFSCRNGQLLVFKVPAEMVK